MEDGCSTTFWFGQPTVAGKPAKSRRPWDGILEIQ